MSSGPARVRRRGRRCEEVRIVSTLRGSRRRTRVHLISSPITSGPLWGRGCAAILARPGSGRRTDRRKSDDQERLDVLRVVRVAVRRTDRLTEPGSVASHRPGAVREGQGCLGVGVPPERLQHPLKRTRPKGASDPGGERIGGTRRSVRSRPGYARWPGITVRSRWFRHDLPFDVGDVGCARSAATAPARLREPESVRRPVNAVKVVSATSA